LQTFPDVDLFVFAANIGNVEQTQVISEDI